MSTFNDSKILCRYHAGLGTGHERYRRELPFGLVYHYDPADDGPEIDIIRHERENQFIEWFQTMPERWQKAWKAAKEFVRKHRT